MFQRFLLLHYWQQELSTLFFSRGSISNGHPFSVTSVFFWVIAMNLSSQMKKQISNGQLQRSFSTIVDHIKKKNIFDSSALPIEYSAIFSLYLYLSKLNSDGETFQKISDYIDWRERVFDSSSTFTLDQILGCNVLSIFKRMPECHFGYDKNRRPVIYFLFSLHNTSDVLSVITRKQLFEYHLWQNDAILDLCYYKTLEVGSMITSCTLVIDIAGITSATASPEFLQLLNRRADFHGRFFPFLFDRILIINASANDTKTIRIFKDFCTTFAPRANVYVTGSF
jgi:hypothetical protein